MSEAKVKQLKHFEAPKELGVHYRLLCLTGENKGIAYFLEGNRIILGRSDKADIVLKDLKSSREHAELTNANNDYVVTDLGSQNGIVVNDLKIKQHKLKEGDKLIIGSTVFKFGKVSVGDNKKQDKIEELKDKLDKVKRGEADEAEAKADKEGTGEKKKIKPLHLVIVLGVLLLLFTGGDDKDGKKKDAGSKKSSYKLNEISSEFETAIQKRRYSQDRELKDKLNGIFQKGLREFREENYFRAMNEFNLALVLSPNDAQAHFYLQKTKDALDRKIKRYKNKAKRDEDALHFNSAVVSYCSIVRLLHNYPEDERYKEAELGLRDMEKKLDMEEDEISCIQK